MPRDLGVTVTGPRDLGVTVDPAVLHDYLAGAKAAEADKPGVGEALLRGAGQGATLSFGDEAQGVLQGLALKAGQGSEADQRKGLLDLIRQQRDIARSENKRASEAHPVANLVGEMAGGAPLALASTPAKGLSAGAKLRQLVQGGAAIGSLNALGASQTDLLNGKTGTGEAVQAPLAGAAGGAAAALAPEALGAAAAKLGPLMNRAGNSMARRVLTTSGGIADRFPVTDASIEAAYKAGAFKPFGTTEHAANMLSDALEAAGALKGDVVKALDAAGIDGPTRVALYQQIRRKAQDVARTEPGTGKAAIYERLAEEIGAGGTYGPMSIAESEQVKTSLQRAAKKSGGYGTAEPFGGEARAEVASIVRQAIEDSVERQAGQAAISAGGHIPAGLEHVPRAAAALLPAKQQYALLAPAAAASEESLRRLTRNNQVGLRETMSGASALGGLLASGHSAPESLAGAAAAGLLAKGLTKYGPSTAAWGLKGAAGLPAKAAWLARVLRDRGIAPLAAEAVEHEVEK